jgi:hypothetical protein
MKKIIGISLITATILSAGSVFINPLSVHDRAIDNGGATMSALQSYQDGVGAALVDPISGVLPTDNTAMNTLVFTYGNAAELSNSSIASQVLNNTVNPPALDVKLANSLLVQTAAAAHTDGSLCDDGDPTTHSEYWFNDVCQGGVENVYLNGSACDDGDPATTGETWLNDVCQGGGTVNVYVNGTPCNDGNSLTTGETWLNDVCQGGLTVAAAAGANGVACDDGNSATVKETWLNGVCQGGVIATTASIEGKTCNDGVTATLSDYYHNGICGGKPTSKQPTIASNICSQTYGTYYPPIFGSFSASVKNTYFWGLDGKTTETSGYAPLYVPFTAGKAGWVCAGEFREVSPGTYWKAYSYETKEITYKPIPNPICASGQLVINHMEGTNQVVSWMQLTGKSYFVNYNYDSAACNSCPTGTFLTPDGIQCVK